MRWPGMRNRKDSEEYSEDSNCKVNLINKSFKPYDIIKDSSHAPGGNKTDTIGADVTGMPKLEALGGK